MAQLMQELRKLEPQQGVVLGQELTPVLVLRQ